ncbi:MAG: type II toxin-antitoxin system Phd/YefM family antitoxin [Rhodoglobus sp.]
MQTLPISKVKDRLNELVDSASQTHEQVTITKNGTPAAILIGMAEWETLQETLFWQSQDDNRDTIARARTELANGEGLTEEQIRAEFGVPKRKA